MGITIHFEGKLKNNISVNEIIAISREFAKKEFSSYKEFEYENNYFQRVKNEQDWDYYSSANGIIIQPDENTDPLIFEFDENNYIQNYCKTQYADIDIHIKIIELLKLIEPYFEELNVIDEGEYWDTGDKNLLRKLIDDCFVAIENAKKENSKINGPYRTKKGRIIDLME
jgi:hypothetical protein